MNYARSLFAGLFALLCSASLTHAQVLRCEDASGRVTYTDKDCPSSQAATEVLPPLSPQEQALQDERYRQALERKNEALARMAERDAALRQAEAERAATLAAQRPPPPTQPPVVEDAPMPIYGPLYPPHPPHIRPPPRPRPPNTQADGYNCNVFRCYDGKGNTWSRP